MSFKGLETSYGANENFFIVPHGDEFKLYVVPENRRNGTQSYDGYFPRFYKKLSAAKAGLTKFLGKPEQWYEVTDNGRGVADE